MEPDRVVVKTTKLT